MQPEIPRQGSYRYYSNRDYFDYDQRRDDYEIGYYYDDYPSYDTAFRPYQQVPINPNALVKPSYRPPGIIQNLVIFEFDN